MTRSYTTQPNTTFWDWFFAPVGGIYNIIAKTASSKNANKRNDALYNELVSQGYSPSVAESLVSQYGDTAASGLFDFKNMGDQTDSEYLNQLTKSIDEAYNKYGAMPELLSLDELSNIYNNAISEINRENADIESLYGQNLDRTTEALNRELLENQRAFSDYRNQMLTNEIMGQQAIAGSTRYELDRQQRNAISRGASAAQRLVSNINTQLGLQAQSAQQSLNTSNALAQQLLAQRQAQAGIRQDYMNAQNQYTSNLASLRSGQAERKAQYGTFMQDKARSDRDYARSAWEQNINDSLGSDSTALSMFKNKYGTNKL